MLRVGLLEGAEQPTSGLAAAALYTLLTGALLMTSSNVKAIATVSYGNAIEVALAGSSATVLRVSKHSTRHGATMTAPVLLGVQGEVLLSSTGALTLSVLRGEAGSTSKPVEVVLPSGVHCSALTRVRNITDAVFTACKDNTGVGALSRVTVSPGIRFPGVFFPHGMQLPLKCAPPSLPLDTLANADTNVTCVGTFTLPPQVATQLANRSKAYPINWNQEDQDASWLQPARLLLFLQMPLPNVAYAASMMLNKTALDPLPAYETRHPNSGRFNGYYFDVSSAAAAPGTATNVTLVLPSAIVGRMAGLFFENVEPILNTVELPFGW